MTKYYKTLSNDPEETLMISWSGICRKCGLSCAIWESDLVDGPVIDYTDSERELLK